MLYAALLAIGSEIIDGRIMDTNSNYLCKELGLLGIPVRQILTCDDNIDDITAALAYISAKSEIILISGGLGPTTDDLTREAVARYYQCKLVLKEEALRDIKSMYERRGRKYDNSNDVQAYLPENSEIIKNPVGSAPGFYVGEKGAFLASLPGVPSELKAMFKETVAPLLKKSFPHAKGASIKGFKCFGLPEATIGSRIKALNFPDEISVSYRAAFPEVHVALKSFSAELPKFFEEAKRAVGEDFIFTEDLNETFEERLHKLLLEKNVTVAAAESCTAGILSGLLTNTPGSSRYFKGGVVSYANEAKRSLLDVPAATLESFGAVSRETAEAMAQAARVKFNADLGISITGIAGPGGGSEKRPVGLFYIGISSTSAVSAVRGFNPLDRKRIRAFAAHTALDSLRRHLTNLAPLPDARLPNQVEDIR